MLNHMISNTLIIILFIRTSLAIINMNSMTIIANINKVSIIVIFISSIAKTLSPQP